MPFVLKHSSGQYYLRTKNYSSSSGLGPNRLGPDINLAVIYSKPSQAQSVINIESRLQLEMVPILIVDLNQLSDVERPLIENYQLVRKLG